jgi:hypothetical protein
VRRLAAGHLLPLSALAALPLLLFRHAVFGGGALYERDIYLYWHAQVEALVRSAGAGAWPLWDPLASFGEPLWEMPILYPTTWLNLLLPAWSFYTLTAVLHCAFGGIGLYLLAHRLGCSRLASLASAALWVVSGPQLSVVNLPNLLQGAAWMPWTLLAVESALRTGEDLKALGWGACLAAQVLVASETGLMLGLLGAAWTVAAFASGGGAGRGRVVRVAAIALVFAVTLSAATWLPFLSLAGRTARGELSEEVRTHWSVSPAEMLQTALPIFPRELPLSIEAHPALTELGSPYLYSLYLGVPALALAAAGVFAARRRTALALLGVAVLAALFALGRHSPVYASVIALLPPLRSLRFPVKSMLLFSLAIALLAGLGTDAWRRARRPALVAAGAAGLVLGLLAALAARLAAAPPGALAELVGGSPSSTAALASLVGPLSFVALEGLALAGLAAASARPALAGRLAMIVPLLAVADAAWNQRRLNPTAPRALFRYRPETVEAIRADGGTRIYFRSATGRASPPRPAPAGVGMPLGVGVALTTKLYLTPPAARIQGIASSYVEDVKGVQPTPLVDLYNLLRAVDGTPAHLRLLRLGAVSHTVYLDSFGTDELEPLTSVETLYGNRVLLFRVPGSLPRSYVVGGARIAAGPEALRALVDPSFDPAREIVLPEGKGREVPTRFAGSARVLELTADRVSIEARVDAPGYLVLVDAYDPDWKATVDGRPEALLRANVAFRALPLEAGEHRVEMRYRPRSVVLGLWISALAALAGAAGLAAARWRGAA